MSAGLAVILAAGLALRLWLATSGAYFPDVVQFKIWGEQLAAAPLTDFYQLANPPTDYLPGYLYVLAVVERLRVIVAGPVSLLENYVFWAKLGPIAGDLILAVAAYRVCYPVVGYRRSLIATGLVTFNPGLVFVSAVWGQADSVGCGLAVMSLSMLLSGRPVPAALFAGMAFLTKPQYTLFLPVAGLSYLSSEIHRLWGAPAASWVRWALPRFLLPSATLAATMQLMLLPFSATLWPGPEVDWTLNSRLAVATTKFPVTSYHAFNLWGSPIAGMGLSDGTPAWLSLSYQVWGYLLLAAVMTAALLAAWFRSRNTTVVLWSCFVASFGLFTLLTRMHERYLFVAVVLVSIGVVLARWMIPYFIAVSGLYLVNVVYVYAKDMAGAFPLPPDLPGLATVGSVISVFLFTICIAQLALIVRSTGEPEPCDPTGVSRLRIIE